SVGCFLNFARRHSWPNGDEFIVVVPKQPVSRPYPQHAASCETKTGYLARFAGPWMVGSPFRKRELTEIRRRDAFEICLSANPESSVRRYCQRGHRLKVESIEHFSVEAGQVQAISYEPKKAVLSLGDLVYHRTEQTVVGGEMGTQKTGRWLVWVKCTDSNN